MNVFIAEDEALARERLVATLARVAPQARVLGHADTVRDTQAWLDCNPAPDLLLLDIQLADGLSLELFRDGRLQLPTIFTTAYDQFALQAFQALALDYLLKPVSEVALAQALAKRERWQQLGGLDIERMLLTLRQPQSTGRQRLLARLGNQFHSLKVADIAYFSALDKASVATGLDGRRYPLDESLNELERQLDPQQFFRASRQLLVAAAAIRGFSACGRGRLSLQLEPESLGEHSISQERAAAFKAWLDR